VATVWIPSLARDLTHGQETVEVAGLNVRQIIDGLEQLFPGIKQRFCEGNDLRPGMAVAVDTQIARLGLVQPVGPHSEVHFLPAVAGGARLEPITWPVTDS
jgi:molybdopterin converting factor small subunit